jgi:hypothetical protein
MIDLIATLLLAVAVVYVLFWSMVMAGSLLRLANALEAVQRINAYAVLTEEQKAAIADTLKGESHEG